MKKPLSVPLIQWIIWTILFLLQFFSLLAYGDSTGQAIFYSAINLVSYMVVIYGNAFLLLPRFYEQHKKGRYIFLAFVLLVIVTAFKCWVNSYVYNRFFADKPVEFRWAIVVSIALSTLLVYLSSILFYIALNFFRLKQTQERLQKQHAEAELNLLKAQVQPHFLFNTLNNIYFIAQRESPATAALLEQLSLIMRYFVEEAPKNRISLQAEMDFVKSYIELEKMRMRYPLAVSIEEQAISDIITVPPMLLVPLVENVFKHGIDKRRNDNFIAMVMEVKDGRLLVEVNNRVLQTGSTEGKGGTGLNNLRGRLQLLFGDDQSLATNQANDIFTAQLNIPL